jgi:small subunit ribosomal protein S20
MANTASAKKRARKIVRQTTINRDRLSRIRTFVRRVEDAIAGGEKEAADHRNTAARKLSRLSARIKAL